MASRKRRLGPVRRGVIFTGTFIYAWGFLGVVQVRLPFDLPRLSALTLQTFALPRLDWLQTTGAASPMSSGPTGAIPEPMAWALMMTGMLMIGAALRSMPKGRIRAAY
jgi:hypothetical protein